MACEIVSDSRTVWVNDATGNCVGRFGPMGVDVHNAVAEQSVKGQCHYCTHERPTEAEWSRFATLMRVRHDADVAEHRPKWLPCEHQWQPASEHGSGFYLCTRCQTLGKRQLQGMYRGQIKQTAVLSDRASLSMSGIQTDDPVTRTDDDPRAAMHNKAVSSRLGGHANHGVDVPKRPRVKL